MKAVLFDLDGTLIEPYEGITKSILYALDKLGYAAPDETALRDFIGPPLTGSFETHCGMDLETARRAVAAFRERFSVQGILECELYDGVFAMLERLRDAGYDLFIATSKPEPFAVRIAERLGVRPLLSGVYGSFLDNTRVEKWEVICALLDERRPEQAVMVGDRKNDLDGARRAGIPGIGVLYGYGSRAELEAEHPLALVETPEALASYLLETF